MSNKLTRTYLVSVVQTVRFGTEHTVEATSREEAIEKVVNREGEQAEDGLDWDRASFDDPVLGDWDPIKRNIVKPGVASARRYER